MLGKAARVFIRAAKMKNEIIPLKSGLFFLASGNAD
tara:strand:+ start:460 stop:567 length:108 start_codon:yes stop_codon:yes gene_type:complete